MEQDAAWHIGSFIGSLLVGSVSGAICFRFARDRGHDGFAWFALIACIFLGLIGGLIFVFPAFLLFSLLSFILPSYAEPAQAGGPSSGNNGCLKSGIILAISAAILSLVFVGLVILGFIVEKRDDETYFETIRRLGNEPFWEREASNMTAEHQLPDFRTFRAVDGRTMEAKLVSFDGSNVTVIRRDGGVFRNPVTLYSSDDQEYIRRYQNMLE